MAYPLRFRPLLLPAIPFLLLLITNTNTTFGQIDLVHHPQGFVYNAGKCNTAPVTLSFFIDNACPDAMAALPIMLKVAQQLGPEKVQLVTHLFSLPYHRNAHTIAKGAHVINANCNVSATYDWFQIVYDHIDTLSTSGSAKLNDDQVMDILAPLAQKVSGIPQAKFRQDVNDRAVEMTTRRDFKYGCTRGVYETPFYMLNDVIIPADKSWTVDQWVTLINSLLPDETDIKPTKDKNNNVTDRIESVRENQSTVQAADHGESTAGSIDRLEPLFVLANCLVVMTFR